MNPNCAVGVTFETGNCYLEFCSGQQTSENKFQNKNSLFVLDNAFYCMDVGNAIVQVIDDFDMFGETFITKEQWATVYQSASAFDNETRQVLEEINHWVMHTLDEDAFTILGV